MTHIDVLLPRPCTLEPVRVGIKDGLIASISPAEGPCGLVAMPGFIDIHTHGGAMVDVNHITGRSDLETLSHFYACHGVTSVLLSVMTDTKERMKELVRTLAAGLEEPLGGADIVGIHLEGPFLSPEYRGAMPEDLVLKGDWDFLQELLEAGRGKVRYITLAPEVEGVMDLIGKLALDGRVGISMGHSSADYETAMRAVDAGVRSATHLFNAMKLFHMHRPAVSGAALESDEVYTELIVDGFHLHPATVRLVAKTKGWDRIIAVSDSIMASGLGSGRYKLGVNDVIVGEDGDAKLPDGVRAGSTLTLDVAYRRLKAFTGAGDHLLAKALSTNAARLLKLDDRGVVAVGKRADLVLLDRDGTVARTIVAGRTVYDKGE